MKAGGTRRSETGAATVRALRSVLAATGGNAKLLELYRVLSVKEAADFLGLAEQTVHNMTSKRQLPCLRNGKHALGYRVIDLIGWQEARVQPASV